nr:nicotianamine synthase, S-adenosyl-L-methionine-dependent methyltransferase [Tanacetum cinerariifolium]
MWPQRRCSGRYPIRAFPFDVSRATCRPRKISPATSHRGFLGIVAGENGNCCSVIRLCGEAEGLLEAHFSTILGCFKNPLYHLNIFPYYSNYLKLGCLEYDIFNKHYSTTTQKALKRVAFVGSGPLPFTSIVLASYHLKNTTMVFHTSDIMDVTDDLKNYDVIFLAALVGMNIDDKNKVIQHLAKYMASGAILMLRSAHDDDVINSIVILRKIVESVNIDNNYHDLDIGSLMGSSCKYCDIQPFNHPLGHRKMIDESM